MGILRLILALAVVAAHGASIFSAKMVGGQIAVQAFFIISGFYMSLILNEKYIGKNGSYNLFISNRFFRLYPIYWTVLILSLVACIGVGILTKGKLHLTLDSYMAVKANVVSFGYLILTNLVIFGQDLCLFLGIIPENGQLFFTSNFETTSPALHHFLFIPQAWTLSLELTFYLIAPFLLRKGPKLIGSIVIISFLLRLFIFDYLHLQHDPWTHRFFPTEIMFFLLGYFSYHLYLKIKQTTIDKRLNILAVVYIIAFTLCYPAIPDLRPAYCPFTIKEILYFSSIVLLIPVLFNCLKRNRFDTQIGELSYPVYISHFLIITVCRGLPFGIFKIEWVMVIIVLLSSWLLNQLIANPLEKFRQARVK
jgi:peptidoglycan/LPS O-acetylase OafA/YrhL